MRDEKWVNSWKEHINALNGLMWIPNDKDSRRIRKIIDELNDIVLRNKVMKNE